MEEYKHPNFELEELIGKPGQEWRCKYDTFIEAIEKRPDLAIDLAKCMKQARAVHVANVRSRKKNR